MRCRGVLGTKEYVCVGGMHQEMVRTKVREVMGAGCWMGGTAESERGPPQLSHEHSQPCTHTWAHLTHTHAQALRSCSHIHNFCVYSHMHALTYMHTHTCADLTHVHTHTHRSTHPSLEPSSTRRTQEGRVVWTHFLLWGGVGTGPPKEREA